MLNNIWKNINMPKLIDLMTVIKNVINVCSKNLFTYALIYEMFVM